jgi:hypothetical protein
MVWVVLIRQNLTACDTIHRGPNTQRTLSEHVFDTEDEALKFYEGQRVMLKFAGLAGQYVTYPVSHESYTPSTHFCDECCKGFTVDENDPGFSDLPNGNFCSRTCFRNSFQSNRNDYDEPYHEDDY